MSDLRQLDTLEAYYKLHKETEATLKGAPYIMKIHLRDGNIFRECSIDELYLESIVQMTDSKLNVETLGNVFDIANNITFIEIGKNVSTFNGSTWNSSSARINALANLATNLINKASSFDDVKGYTVKTSKGTYQYTSLKQMNECPLFIHNFDDQSVITAHLESDWVSSL